MKPGEPLVPLTAAVAEVTGLVIGCVGWLGGAPTVVRVNVGRSATVAYLLEAKVIPAVPPAGPLRMKPSLVAGLLSHPCTTAMPGGVSVRVAKPAELAESVPSTVVPASL